MPVSTTHAAGQTITAADINAIATLLNAVEAATLTVEQVQDIVGAMAVAGANATVTYNDGAGTLTIAASGGGGGGGSVVTIDSDGTLIVDGTTVEVATDAQLLAHTSASTSVHGITDTAALLDKTIVDAKGDLLVGTAADTVARKAVGTDGQVLTADAASTGGVKWASPGAVVEEAWHTVGSGGSEPAFAGAWANVGGGFQTLQYKKVGNEVRIRGVVSGTAGTVFTLPAGYRPPLATDVPVTSEFSNSPIYAQVLTTGALAVTAASASYISFSTQFWIDS